MRPGLAGGRALFPFSLGPLRRLGHVFDGQELTVLEPEFWKEHGEESWQLRSLAL